MNRIFLASMLMACAGLGVGCGSSSHYERLPEFSEATIDSYGASRAHCVKGCSDCPPPMAQAALPPPPPPPPQPVVAVAPPPPPPPSPPQPTCELGWYFDCPSKEFIVWDVTSNMEVGRILPDSSNGPMIDQTRFTNELSAITNRHCNGSPSFSSPRTPSSPLRLP